MPSAAPAHALLSAAHSLLRPAMHHGRDPPPITHTTDTTHTTHNTHTDLLPIDEVTLPEVADLRDVVDAINRLCDNMKTSSYDDPKLTETVNEEVPLSVDLQVRVAKCYDSSHVAERVEFGLDTRLAPLEVEEWSENVIQDALAKGWSESVATNVHVTEDMDSIFRKVVSKGWSANVVQENVIVEECSEFAEPVEELKEVFQEGNEDRSKTVERRSLAEGWDTNVEFKTGQFSNRSDVQSVTPTGGNLRLFPKECIESRNVLPGRIEETSDDQNSGSATGEGQTALPEVWVAPDVQKVAHADGYVQIDQVGSGDFLPGQVPVTPDVQNSRSAPGKVQTTLPEVWVALNDQNVGPADGNVQMGQGSRDVLPGQAPVTPDNVAPSDGNVQEWVGSEEVTWDGGGSELYYTASSEVSLVSEAELGAEAAAEGRGAAAGHVAAMRERFESMTRAPTPVEHATRDHSPSPAP